MAATLAERTLGRPVLRTTIDVDLPRLARKSTIYYYSGSGAEGKKAKHEQEQEQEQEQKRQEYICRGRVFELWCLVDC